MNIPMCNKQKIVTMLDEVQRFSRTRCVSFELIESRVNKIEKTLRQHFTLKEMRGIKIWIDEHARHYPASYFGKPHSTQVHVERKAQGWTIISIKREVTGPGKFGIYNLQGREDKLIKIGTSTLHRD